MPGFTWKQALDVLAPCQNCQVVLEAAADPTAHETICLEALRRSLEVEWVFSWEPLVPRVQNPLVQVLSHLAAEYHPRGHVVDVPHVDLLTFDAWCTKVHEREVPLWTMSFSCGLGFGCA